MMYEVNIRVILTDNGFMNSTRQRGFMARGFVILLFVREFVKPFSCVRWVRCVLDTRQ